jgi:hypothetical protein
MIQPAGIDKLEVKLKTARDNPHWYCRHHPTDWFHEIGCPHMKWTVEQLQDALDESRAMIRVLQHELYGLPLDGNPKITYHSDTSET